MAVSRPGCPAVHQARVSLALATKQCRLWVVYAMDSVLMNMTRLRRVSRL